MPGVFINNLNVQNLSFAVADERVVGDDDMDSLINAAEPEASGIGQIILHFLPV